MQLQQTEWLWLDAREQVSLSELSRICGLSTDELDELVDYGALAPVVAIEAERVFSAACVAPLRRASRLRHDFDLDLMAVAVVLDQFNRIEALEAQVRALRARMPAQGDNQDHGPNHTP